MKRSLSIPARLLALLGAMLLGLVVAAPTADANIFQNQVWITNATTSACLDVPGDGAPSPCDRVGVFECTLGDNQFWDLIGTGSFPYTYPNGVQVQLDKFVIKKTGKCLDVDGVAANGTDQGNRTTWLYDCIVPGGGTDDHRWYAL
ncbi:RICIN domain-containing protein [Kitasatospora purpeofusca]|uniref:RICIN domain-containing protein n=1 Tax=Kitasatospora purpeofusca TaxID=67352 RepID=UPI003869FCCA|nr:RICIN domain-containing protein [Kitasatospora purpeofusca]